MTLLQKVRSEMPKGQTVRPEVARALKAVQEMHNISAKVPGSASRLYESSHCGKK
jgi:hypothetical protein